MAGTVTLFKSETAQQVWMENYCQRCWHLPVGCPILDRALASGRKPKEWVRNPRPAQALMQNAYACKEFAIQPPVSRRGPQQFEDVPMFDVDTSMPVHLVPVEGWPDRPPGKGVDHA